MNSSSRLIDEAIEQLASLPSIGRKSAMRLALDLLKRSPEEVKAFSDAFTEMRNNIRFCKRCNNLSDHEECHICNNPSRDSSLVCIVEDIRDVMAIENTSQFKGHYHVLGGVISPMDGISPQDLSIDRLVERVKNKEAREIIFALSATMEGDTTCFYIYKKLMPYDLTVSTLSRGVAVGDELQYADELTLGRSIVNRTPYQNAIAG